MAGFDVSLALRVLNADGMVRDLGRVEGSVDRIGGAAVRTESGADRLSEAVGRVAHYGLAGGALAAMVGTLTGMGRAMFEASVSAQRLSMGLSFATGNAPAEIAYLRKLTDQLGLQFVSTADAYMKFSAAVRQTALEGAGARQVFEAVSKASAVMGLSAEQSQGALLALQQMISKGTVSAEELRGQLGERLPGAFQIAARSMGVTTAELGKMLEQGQLLSEDFLPKFAQQLEQELGGAADKAAARLEASVNRMANAWEKLKQTVGDSGVSEGAVVAVSALTKDMNAVSEAMDRAKARGAGFFGQMNEGLGMVIGRSLQLQRISPVFMTNAGAAQYMKEKLVEAETQIGVLQQRLSLNPESFYLRNDIYQLQQFIDKAREAQVLANMPDQTDAETRRLNLGGFRQDDAETARLKRNSALLGTQVQRSDVFKQYASDADKLAQELMRVREIFKGMIPPEIEAAIRERFKGTNKDIERQQELLTQLSGYSKDYARDVADIIALRKRGNIDEATYVNLLNDLVAKQPIVAKALKEQADAIAARNKAMMEAEADVDAYEAAQLNVQKQAVDAAEAAFKSAQAELDAFGKLKSEIAETSLIRLKDALAAETAGTTGYASIYRQIEAQEKLIEVLKKGEARDAGIEAANKTSDEWKRAGEDIERSLTDALMRGFESGRGFVDSLTSTIKSTFQTMVLRPMVQAVVRPVAGAVGSALGMPSMAGQVGGGAGGSALGSMLGLSGLGSAFSAGAGLTMSGAGGVAGASIFSGTGLALEGAGAMMSGGSMMGGLAQAAGALGPYVAAAMALYAVYKAVKHTPTPHMGSAVGIGADGAASTLYGDPSRILDNYQAETDAALRGLGGASTGSLNALSTAFGGTGGFSSVLKFAADGKDASIGSLGFSRDGQAMAGSFGINTDYNKYSSDRETAFKAYTVDVAKATREALSTVGLPDWAREQFKALGNDSTIEQFAALADSVTKFQTGLRDMQRAVAQIGGVFGRVADLGGDALKQLADFAGGIENFTRMTQSYVQDYYSRDEIAALKAREIQGVLQGAGITGDVSTREQFRAIVEGLDVGSEAGRRQLATLLGVSGSFTGVADYLAETGSTLSQVAAKAPEMGSLGPLLSTGNAQVVATNEVRDAISDMHRDLVEAVRSNSSGAYRGSSDAYRGQGRTVEVGVSDGGGGS